MMLEYILMRLWCDKHTNEEEIETDE